MPSKNGFTKYNKYAQIAHGAYKIGKSLYNKYKSSKSTALKNRPRMKRPYKGRKSRGEKGTASGTIREQMTFNHGHPDHLLKGRRRRAIIESITPVNNALVQQSTQITNTSFGQTTWAVYHLGLSNDYADILNSDSQLNQKSSKFVLRSQQQELEMTNMSNTSCYIRVYDYVYRHDLPAYNSSGAFITTTAQWFNALITNGFANAVNSVGYTTLSSNIYDDPTFCSFCKVVKQRLIELSPGQTIKVNQFDRTSKSINANVVGTNLYGNSPYYAMKGFSRGLLLQVWGQVVDDQTSSTLCSTDKVKVSVIQKIKYEYQWVLDSNPSSYLMINSLGAVAAAQSINELADGVINSTTA